MPWSAATSSNRSVQGARRLIPAVHVVRRDQSNQHAARHLHGSLVVILAALAALLLGLAASPALAASIQLPVHSTPLVRQAEPSAREAREAETTAAGDDETASQAEARRAILYRQGAQTAASLARVAPVTVVNPLPVPEPQPAVPPAPVAAPADTAADHAMPDTAASVQQAQQMLTPRAPVVAGATRSVQAVVGAILRGAAATDAPLTPAATSAASAVPREVPSLPFSRLPVLTLLVMLSGMLMTRIWQMRREPFVLKVKPVKV